MKSFTKVLFCFTAMSFLWCGSVLAVDSEPIEEVMREYQNIYHYVAVAKNYDDKYLVWPDHNCSGAPSYPINFYGEITEDEAESLVANIVNKFYETGSGKSNISDCFLKELPEGKEHERTVTITPPDPEDSWQDRLNQICSDIDKYLYFDAGPASCVDRIIREGYGSDSAEFAGTGCDWHRTSNGTFADAESEAVSEWYDSDSNCGPIGVATKSYHDHFVVKFCGDTKTLNYDNYSAFVRSENAKLYYDFTEHTGSAYCYLKLKDSYVSIDCGNYSSTDGIHDTNPVSVDDPNEKFHSWGSPSTGDEWTSSYLFSTAPPDIPGPSRTTIGPDDNGNYTKYNEEAWFLDETLIVVEPVYETETDSVLSCSSPEELVYKNMDKHIVYSAGVDCGYESGEKVNGRIIVDDYVTGMKVEVQLNEVFSGKVAKLEIGDNPVNITPDDTEAIYCFSPIQDDPNSYYYVPFSVQAYVNEDRVSFSIASVYSEELGDATTDPNQFERVKAYRGEGGNISFQIKTNGYECCNRKETLSTGYDKPQLFKHENGDIEIFFPDIREAYIWGNLDSGSGSYSRTCGFLDMAIAEYIPEGGSSGEYIILSGSQGSSLVYSVGPGWLTEDTSAGSSFTWELNSDGEIINEAGYDGNGRLVTISNSSDPDNYYTQYSYDDQSNPDRMTSYTTYAGQISRTYTFVYDETTGRLAGTIGGAGQGCGSCALDGESHLYTYNDSGSVLTVSDTEESVIYEYEYDPDDRLIAKWLGPKTDLKPIQEVFYETHTDDFGGIEIKDVYDYVTDVDYRFTRNILDEFGQVIAEINFDTLNIDRETVSSDPNVILASGGYITTYNYEYDGSVLDSIITKSPLFNEGTTYSYYKNTLNNSSNNYEDTILVEVDPEGIEPDEETVISRNHYSSYTLNGVSTRRLQRTYDARGYEDDVYTRYAYSSNGPLSDRDEPEVYQLNDDYTELNYNYTYYADGQIKTETVSNNDQDNTKLITTYFYNHLGHLIKTETRDYYGYLYYTTKFKCNGFGDQIYSIDKNGVAKGKEYDSMGNVISEFVFADPNDTLLFEGDDPNALTEDISSVYTNLDVVSQTIYMYNSLGRLSQVKVAVAESVFTYDSPGDWHITSYTYDDYGRKIQQTEDTTGLSLVTSYEYNNQDQLIKTIYPDGRWHKKLYNGRGLVIKTIDGHGPEETTPNDFIENETVYDSDGHVVKKIKAGDVITSYELDDRGMVYREYRGDYETEYCDYTEYTRDLDGNVIYQITVEVDSVGNEQVISKIYNRYNARGEIIEKRILADPASGQDDLDDRVKLYNYDYQGRLLETITKADSNDEIYTDIYKDTAEYEEGDLIEQNWYDLDGLSAYTLRFEYAGDDPFYMYPSLPFNNANTAFQYAKANQDVYATRNMYIDNRLYSNDVLKSFNEDDPDFTTDPYAGLIWQPVKRNIYDNSGRVVKIYDADDNFTTFFYNSRNQRTEQILWQGKPVLRLSDGSYDPNTFEPYPLTRSLTDYDTAGRKIRQALLCDPNSTVTVDNVDKSIDKVLDIYYDDYGRLYRQRGYFDGANERITLREYSYDGHSRIDTIEFCELQEADVFGTIWETKTPMKYVSYQYNLKGEKTQETVTNVDTLTSQTSDIDTYFSYDTQGRLDQIENSQAVIYSCEYDALGRKIEETDQVGMVAEYYYNYLGDLTDVIEDPTGLDRQTTYGYDRLGRKKAIISGTDQTDYTFNHLGKVTSITYPDNDVISYYYDMFGNVIRRTVIEGVNSQTTQYKRNALGKICYKQYTDIVDWSEPNSLLPFDEILYDALGNEQIIAYVDGDDDLELNMYSYNGFGKMTDATESYDEFESSVSYGYDQRGLVTSITYPDDKTVGYTRDSMGRIEKVSYDGRVIVEYGYLGNKVNKKTMSGADIEYAATIDSLGRITGEAFGNISTSQNFLTNSYDYTSYSNRLDERNSIDYGFDTLGRVTSEDAASYTCDILGNPTNASDDGYTYTLDEENRITEVSDGIGTLGEYEYGRMGRRTRKTVSATETNFVYDLAGNVIAEYNGDNWARDYVYGAIGELVYMQLPRTSQMNDAYDNFISFVTAWLCYPGCTQQELVWDVNADDQIDFIDWAGGVDANDFAGAFSYNGRYILTDFHNSVVGKVNLDGSVDEITYNAWGTPTVEQGADIEGLSILWNGYYYDSETGNYYLRNRYYSPLERRFVTEDPHGINPAENWNNPFNVFAQYSDGYGLMVYAEGDPVNKFDVFGLACSDKCIPGDFKCKLFVITLHLPGVTDEEPGAEVLTLFSDCYGSSVLVDAETIIKFIKSFKDPKKAAKALATAKTIVEVGLSVKAKIEYDCCNKKETCLFASMISFHRCWRWNWKSFSKDKVITSDLPGLTLSTYGGAAGTEVEEFKNDLTNALRNLKMDAKINCKNSITEVK